MSDYFRDKEPKDLKTRAFIAAIVAVAAFFILIARFWYLQIKESDYYSNLSKTNRIRSVKSPAPRGMIYDRRGISLVENRPGFDLYIVPEDVLDMDETKKRLHELVGIEMELIETRLEQSENRPPFEAIRLKEDLSWEETVGIENYKFELPGVIIEVSPKREYIYADAFAHLIGYISGINDRELKGLKTKRYAPGDLIGKYGLEKSFEDDLRGADGVKEIEVDALGRKINVVNRTKPYPGNDIMLTIDLKAQMAAWEGMAGRAGAVVAIEPDTGRVLALVSSPAFDPNILAGGVAERQWKKMLSNPLNVFTNRPIQGLYPPASTFKPIHALAALEEKVITPRTKIYSGPSFWFGGQEYRDWKTEGHGIINVNRAIVESSDTFFYQTGLKLGVNRLADYSRRFGLGSKTGVPLQNEKTGLVPTTKWKKAVYHIPWYDGETINVSVGQGYMLTTPLQLAVAYATMANGGAQYAPQLVESVTTPARLTVKGFKPIKKGQLNISGDTLDFVKAAMEGVVHDQGGTAHFLTASGLDIAGKTGTAQVSRLGRRTRDISSIKYKYRDHAWFAGYAPYDAPKIAVVVIVEHGGFGAAAAAPVALEVFKAYLRGQAPDEKGLDKKEAPPPENRPGKQSRDTAAQAVYGIKRDETLN